MEIVQNYLDKYKKLTPPQATKAKVIADVICDECGIRVDVKMVSIRRGGAVLSCHPTMRSEIMRCIPQVLDVLQKQHNLRLSFIR